MIKSIFNKLYKFVESNEDYPRITALAAGLYPFLHYYNSNLSIADSWQQLLFLFTLCFIIPQILVRLIPYLLKISFLKFLKPRALTIFNVCVFLGLIAIISLDYRKKATVLTLFVSFWIGYFLYKNLKKIIVLQFLLAIISFLTILPKLHFALNFNNDSWTEISKEELNTTLKIKPNIFVIQPDGYVNFEDLYKPPYNYDKNEFEIWLESEGFTNYKNVRSNYYSTLTSNSSMFAMKHHFYSNTDKSTLKTFYATNVISGNDNNVLTILKNNGYRGHLLTDNSFFLINRPKLKFDFCNIKNGQLSFYDTGSVKGVDIVEDFKTVLDTLQHNSNFFFIEKTIPSHIYYIKRGSKGKEIERLEYLERLELTNEWLKTLIAEINEFDADALIILVADHGGYVGLDYTLQAVTEKLSDEEIISSFSSLLSIKWPEKVNSDSVTFKTPVNLFRKVFYLLSDNPSLITDLQENNSYLPYKENGNYNYYKCIDENANVVFEQID